MKINYNLKGAARKPLVKALSEVLNASSEYLSAPSMCYRIGENVLDVNGELTVGGNVDAEALTNALKQRGFCPVTGENESTEEFIGPEEQAPQSANDALIIEMPKQRANEQNLRNILTAKGELIKKALGVSGLPIEITEETIKFPWFERLLEPDELQAVTKFIAALCKLSCELKRTSAEPREIVNEKYEFRCFLLRLGFIGDQYKTERKILLRDLNGSSAFKLLKQTS